MFKNVGRNFLRGFHQTAFIGSIVFLGAVAIFAATKHDLAAEAGLELKLTMPAHADGIGNYIAADTYHTPEDQAALDALFQQLLAEPKKPTRNEFRILPSGGVFAAINREGKADNLDAARK